MKNIFSNQDLMTSHEMDVALKYFGVKGNSLNLMKELGAKLSENGQYYIIESESVFKYFKSIRPKYFERNKLKNRTDLYIELCSYYHKYHDMM